MTKVPSRRLIIDASVIHSAGETVHPVSSACRECLTGVLIICHHAVLTEKINEEWSRHLSRYSRKWRCSLFAKKKIDPPSSRPISLRLDAFSPLSKAAIEKDLHILEAANAADRIIITRDDALKTALAETPNGLRVRDSFRWINPVTDGSAPLESL